MDQPFSQKFNDKWLNLTPHRQTQQSNVKKRDHQATYN